MFCGRITKKILSAGCVFFVLLTAWAIPDIVVPDQPSPAELRAADELALHLEKAVSGSGPQSLPVAA